MSKVSQWKNMLGLTAKPKSLVLVGQKAELMTDTQAYRFTKLATTRPENPLVSNSNPFGESKYSLEEAAFRLMISEDEVLQRAAAGLMNLHICSAGLEGRWRRVDENGSVIESSLRTLHSGYLALTLHTCKQIAASGEVDVSVFEFPSRAEPSILGFDTETLQELSAWGKEKKCFCVREPKRVDHNAIVLLAPLGSCVK